MAANLGPRFCPCSFWYQKLAAVTPVNSQSALFVTQFRNQVAPQNAGVVAINTLEWTCPVYLASDRDPLVTVGVINPCPNCGIPANPAMAASLTLQFQNVPFPNYAQASPDPDHEMAIYQPSSDTLWEFYDLSNNNGTWQACGGGRMMQVSKKDGTWLSPFGVTGAGVSLAGGQITLEELQAGVIDHVMGIALAHCAPSTTWSWPAQKSDGDGQSDIPQGLRFRLDPTLNLAGLNLPAAAITIAKAAQDYGFVVWDTAETVSLRCKNPLSYTSGIALKPACDPYAPLFSPANESTVLQNFPWERIQFIPNDYGNPPVLD